MRRILTWSRGPRRSASTSTARLSSTDTSETRREKVRLLSLRRQRGTERVTARERETERERERERERGRVKPSGKETVSHGRCKKRDGTSRNDREPIENTDTQQRKRERESERERRNVQDEERNIKEGL